MNRTKNNKNNSKHNSKHKSKHNSNHMVNIFIPELSNIDIKNIEMYLKNKTDKKMFLGFNGFYEYINNTLCKFKIKDEESFSDKIEILDDTNIYCTKNKIIKFEIVNQIPYEHEIKNIQKYIYKTSDNSKNRFIVELINNKVCDYYFESDEEFENKSLQEDIMSFLFKLK